MKKMSRYACLRRAFMAGALSIGIALATVPASAQIVFDPNTETVDIVVIDRLRAGRGENA